MKTNHQRVKTTKEITLKTCQRHNRKAIFCCLPSIFLAKRHVKGRHPNSPESQEMFQKLAGNLTREVVWRPFEERGIILRVWRIDEMKVRIPLSF